MPASDFRGTVELVAPWAIRITNAWVPPFSKKSRTDVAISPSAVLVPKLREKSE